MANPLRMIVMGAGRGQTHARSFLRVPEKFEFAGLVDIDAETLGGALERLGLSADLGYDSFAAALDASGCDGVVIATWARSHDDLVQQALMAGKHVMVEKPLTLLLAPALRLTALAEERDLMMVVTTQWRYLPGQRTVRRLLTENVYGEPQTGHMLSYKARGGEYPDSEHSQLWQMTVHEIDSLISMVNRRVVEVYGHSSRPPKTTWRRESTVTAEVTFESGARFALVSTSDARVNGVDFRAECERGAVVLRDTESFGGDEQVLVGTDRAIGLEPQPLDFELSDRRELDVRVAESFADWVNGGPEPETSARNHLQVLATLNGIIDSGESGQPVQIDV